MKTRPLVAVALAAGLLVSCEKREPSEAELAEAFSSGFEKMRRDQLERDFAELESSKPYLEKIKIQWFKTDRTGSGFDSRIVAEFTNGTDKALKAIRCQFVERDPARQIPYTDDEVLFAFSGGIEPGETKEASARGVRLTSEKNVKRTLLATVLLDGDLNTVADGSMKSSEIDELMKLRAADQ